MTARRWWDLIVAGSLVLLAVITTDGYGVDPRERVGGLLSLTAIGLAYLFWGRRMLRGVTASGMPGDSGFDHLAFPRSAQLFAITLVVASGAATAFDPNLATVQALVFPILWALSASVPGAIVLSALLSLSMGMGLWIGIGRTADAALQATAIEAISFVFALAMGIWITRIADAGAAQRRLVQKLTLAQDELAILHRDAGSAAERERLAREIHDTIAQSLTSLVMLAQRTRTELDALPGDTSAVAESVDLIESTGRDALTEARALVASMAPVRTGDGDLAHTLARLAERFERETGIEVAVDLAGLDLDSGGVDGADLNSAGLNPAGLNSAGLNPAGLNPAGLNPAGLNPAGLKPAGLNPAGLNPAGLTPADAAHPEAHPPLDRAFEVVLLRCAQEGLANVRKHSGAGAATIRIERSDATVTLTVTDNGRGLGDYRPDAENGFGLAGMRDRVHLVGGRLDVNSINAPTVDAQSRGPARSTLTGTTPTGPTPTSTAPTSTAPTGTVLRVVLPTPVAALTGGAA